jgi:hypothetical protein
MLAGFIDRQPLLGGGLSILAGNLCRVWPRLMDRRKNRMAAFPRSNLFLYNPVFPRPAAGRSFARLTISASFAIFAVKIVFAFLKWHPRVFRRRRLAGKVFRFKF